MIGAWRNRTLSIGFLSAGLGWAGGILAAYVGSRLEPPFWQLVIPFGLAIAGIVTSDLSDEETM